MSDVTRKIVQDIFDTNFGDIAEVANVDLEGYYAHPIVWDVREDETGIYTGEVTYCTFNEGYGGEHDQENTVYDFAIERNEDGGWDLYLLRKPGN